MASSKYSVDRNGPDDTWTFMIRTESREEMELYLNGPRYQSTLAEMAERLRQCRKYSQNEEESKLAATFEQMLFHILEDNELKL